MKTLLERATRSLKTGLDATASKSVTVRDGAEAIPVTAVPGNKEFLQYTTDDYAGTSQNFDWIVAASDLLFNGVKREPARGWQIWLDLEDGRRAIYEVLPDEATRAFDVVDHLGILYRIHTKLDRIETIP